MVVEVVLLGDEIATCSRVPFWYSSVASGSVAEMPGRVAYELSAHPEEFR